MKLHASDVSRLQRADICTVHAQCLLTVCWLMVHLCLLNGEGSEKPGNTGWPNEVSPPMLFAVQGVNRERGREGRDSWNQPKRSPSPAV